MPRQARLRTIKRWQRYQPRDNWSLVPRNTRGLYVLYRKRKVDRYEVCYIGVAGLGVTGGGGIRSRLKSHNAKKPDWTHYSLFEVHDNVTREEIRELEKQGFVAVRFGLSPPPESVPDVRYQWRPSNH